MTHARFEMLGFAGKQHFIAVARERRRYAAFFKSITQTPNSPVRLVGLSAVQRVLKN